MEMLIDKQKSAYGKLKGVFSYRNVHEVPRITKIVVSTGVGKTAKDKARMQVVEDRLARMTGQKAVRRGAKKSIASFKVREGDTVGYQVTLRGAHMHDFLNKLIHVVLPRTRDFRGISREAVDSMGNLTIGIREHNIFPETSDEDLKDVFSLAVTFVTTAKSKDEALGYFTHIGIPFKKKAAEARAA